MVRGHVYIVYFICMSIDRAAAIHRVFQVVMSYLLQMLPISYLMWWTCFNTVIEDYMD